MSSKLGTSTVIIGCLLRRCIFMNSWINSQHTLQAICACYNVDFFFFTLRCNVYVYALKKKKNYDNYFLFRLHGENHYTLGVWTAHWIPISLLCADCLQYTHGEKLTTTSLQDSFPHIALNLLSSLSYFLKGNKYAQETPICSHH